MESDENSFGSTEGMPVFENHRDNVTSIDLTSSFISIKDEPLHSGNYSSTDPLSQNSKKNHLDSGKTRLPMRETTNSTETARSESIESLVLNDISNHSEESDDLDNNSIEDVSTSLDEIDSELVVNYIEDPLEDTLLLEDNTLSCSVCSFTTDKKRTLHDHERNHRRSNHPIVECFYCRQRYTRKMLYNHIQTVHPGQKFQIRDDDSSEHSNSGMLSCSSCSFSTGELPELKSHIKEHHSESASTTDDTPEPEEELSGSSINCFTGPSATTDQAKPEMHEEEHNFEPIKKKNQRGQIFYCCRKCSYRCSYLPDMNKHINTHKKNMEILKCLKCDFRSTSFALKFHMKKCRRKSQARIGAVTNISRNEPILTCVRRIPFKNVQPGEALIEKNVESLVCFVCQFTTYDRETLREHLNEHNFQPLTQHGNGAGRHIYDCKYCSYSSSLIGINTHMNLHRQNMPILKCPKCDYKSTKFALSFHIAKCHEAEEEHLNETVQTDDGQNSAEAPTSHSKFKCPTCAYSTDSEQQLSLHDKEHIFEPLYKANCIQKFSCRLCSYWSRKYYAIASHINSHKKSMPIEKCPNCDFKSTSHALKFHIRKCGEKTQSPINQTIHRTEESRQEKSGEVSSESATSQHQVSFLCFTCSFSTSEKEMLKLHIKEHFKEPLKITDASGRLIYQCEMCSYNCQSSEDMDKHLNAHKFNLPIEKCPNCFFKSTPRALMIHEQNCKKKVHANSAKEGAGARNLVALRTKPKSLFRCTKCPFITCLRIKLNLHIEKRHSKSKKKSLKCPNCSFVAKKPCSLALHRVTHSGKAPLIPCPNCSFRSTPAVMRKHFLECGVAPSAELFSPTAEVSSPSAEVSSPSAEVSSPSTEVSSPSAESSSPRKYACQFCPYTTDTPQGYSGHTKKHVSPKRSTDKIAPSPVDNSPLRCLECSFSTPLRWKMTLHSKMYHRNLNKLQSNMGHNAESNRYKCSLCSYVASMPYVISRHFQTHLKKLPIQKCQKCDYRSTWKALKIHSRTCDGKPSQRGSSAKRKRVRVNAVFRKIRPDSIRRYKCDYCPLKATFKQNLKNHVEITHLDQVLDQKTHQLFRCKDCNFVSLYRKKLSKHLKDTNHVELSKKRIKDSAEYSENTEHSKRLKMTAKENAERAETVKKTKVKSADKDHAERQKEVQGNRPSAENQCPKCIFSTAHKASLKRHMRLHVKSVMRDVAPEKTVAETSSSSRGSFSCTLCSYTSNISSNFRVHLLAHEKHNLPILQCAHCDFRSTPMALRKHNDKCVGSGPKQTTEKQLKKHVPNGLPSIRSIKSAKSSNAETKSGLRQCKLCSYSTRLHSCFKTHMTRHSKNQITLKKCDYCDFKAGVKIVNKHRLQCPKKTPLKVYYCSECSYSSYYPNRVKEHERKNHPCEAEEPNSHPKSFKCEYCSFTSFWQYLIEKHMSSHTLLKLPIEQCSKCDFRSTPAALAAHMNSCKKEPHDAIVPPRKKMKTSTNIVRKSELPVVAKSNPESNGIWVSPPAITAKPEFNCPKCSFSTSLRIKLKFHLQKSHNIV